MKITHLKSIIQAILFFVLIGLSVQSCDLFDPDNPPVVVDSLGVSITSVTFTCNKDASLIIVRTKDEWTATASSQWISMSANSGKGNTAFLIGVTDNNDFKRTAKVSITSGGKTKEIKVAQEGATRMVLTISGINVLFRKIDSTMYVMSGMDNVSNFGIGHYVTLSEYYIMETEVTNELWKAVMKALPYDTIAVFAGHNQHLKPLQPVSATNWNDITNKFIPAINLLTGKKTKLPTEAQWEYAARGGKYSQGKKYSGSDKLDDVAWYYQNADGQKHNVGEKNPNELGLYDMSGNVSEWCSDWYDQNFGFTVQNGTIIVPPNSTNPAGPATGTKKVVRGGSYTSEEVWGFSDCHVKDRRSIKPNGYDTYEGNPVVFFMSKNTGFRLVITQ